MIMTNENLERQESDILYSKTVKAGKRIYYIDVKQDRRKELYLSLTESKRVKDGGDDLRPVFEKHKIFLYREDFNKFINALVDAADYANDHAPASSTYGSTHTSTYFNETEPAGDRLNPADEQVLDEYHKSADDFRLDIDF